jgi:molybdate/tungstate transport system substrate-binding protein
MTQSGFRDWWQGVPGGARGGDNYRQRSSPAQTGPRLRPWILLAIALAAVAAPAGAQAPGGPLVVYNAGSLARPFRELLDAFRAGNSAVIPAQENSGSLEAARKLTELGKIPDVLAVADYNVIDDLLRPKYATWYASFARNAMVLAYTGRSIDAATIDSTNWWQVLLKKGVRTGHSDPALDPNGYRTLIVLQLAERYYRQPGLARRLDAAMPPRYQRPKEADLTALLQAGELDYAWTYRSLAETSGLRYVSLPKAIDLSDPALVKDYEAASVRIPGANRSGGDSLTFRGEPIVYALTIPVGAPHPALAAAFVRFALSAEGRAILQKNGFVVLPSPLIVGTPPAGLLTMYTPSPSPSGSRQ